jgi:THO complex subunit 2
LKESLGEDSSLEYTSPGGRSSMLLALLQGVCRGILPVPNFVSCVKEIGYSDEEEKYELGDLVWMSWLLQKGLEDGERIVEASVQLVEEGFLSRRILMEVSDGDFMETAGLVNSYKDGWRKREIRLNTRNVYAQRKYNLLREESEGYSKITTLLNQAGSSRVSEANMDGILKEMKSIVGYFDLDPNRVSSLILDAYASYPENEDFVSLIKGFGVQKCAQFLGFRLSRDDALHGGVLKIAAILVKKGLIGMEDLMVYFSPAEEDYASSWAERMAQLDAAIQHIGVISLSSKEPSVDEPVPRKSGQTARTIIIDTAVYRNTPWACSGVDHRLEFLGELFTCGAWDDAIVFSKYLSKLGIRDISAYESVGKAICAIIDRELGDLLGKEGTPLTSETLVSCIQMIGCHLHFNLKAFYKVMALVTKLVDSGEKERAYELLVNTVFPAYNLVPSNVALSHTLWNDILCKMTYEERFHLYAEFEKTVKEYPLLQASEKLAETEVRRILRRVTAPANKKEAKMAMRPIGRLLGKISHANPFIVSRQLLRQVMGMPGMVASISESLRYLTSMTFDVLTFTIVKQLSCGKRKLKEDGVNLEEWFQWLALFTGVVCRNQNGIEVTALLQYVVNQLKGSESLDLLVLKEIISSMTRISPSVDVSNQQLDALAGSDALIQYIVGQEEGREVSGKKDTNRATNRLLHSLKQGSENDRLLLPLLILLAQQRTLIILDPPSKHLKLAAELLDKCQEVTMQYIAFLQKSLMPEEYEEILPSIDDLVNEYKMDPEVVLQLYRPILRKVKPYESEENDEEGEMSDGQLPPNEEGTIEQDGKDHRDEMKVWPKLKQLMTRLAPDGGFSGISWELFVCFWAFELSDLIVPKDRYENTLKQIELSKRNLQDDLASRKDMMRGGQWGPNAGPQVDLGALKAELSVLENLAKILPDDMKSQIENFDRVSSMFAHASTFW